MGFEVRSKLKSNRRAVDAARRIREWKQVFVGEHPEKSKSKLNVLHALPGFSPHSDGTYTQRAAVTLDGANAVFPSLLTVSAMSGRKATSVVSLRDFVEEFPIDQRHGEELKALLDKYGSDKAGAHDYHLLYGALLGDPSRIQQILEIGMGTNNTDVISNMGSLGRPGASLRAFRDFLPNALVFGADVDERILFEEDRIKTFPVDQTSVASLVSLGTSMKSEFDLIIDDGLHAPHANLKTLAFACERVRIGGWVVIEDIDPQARDIWRIAGTLLPDSDFRFTIVTCQAADVVVVQRLTQRSVS